MAIWEFLLIGELEDKARNEWEEIKFPVSLKKVVESA